MVKEHLKLKSAGPPEPRLSLKAINELRYKSIAQNNLKRSNVPAISSPNPGFHRYSPIKMHNSPQEIIENAQNIRLVHKPEPVKPQPNQQRINISVDKYADINQSQNFPILRQSDKNMVRSSQPQEVENVQKINLSQRNIHQSGLQKNILTNSQPPEVENVQKINLSYQNNQQSGVKSSVYNPRATYSVSQPELEKFGVMTGCFDRFETGQKAEPVNPQPVLQNVRLIHTIQSNQPELSKTGLRINSPEFRIDEGQNQRNPRKKSFEVLTVKTRNHQPVQFNQQDVKSIQSLPTAHYQSNSSNSSQENVIRVQQNINSVYNGIRAEKNEPLFLQVKIE